jgi:hypothetical protein
MGNSNGNGNSCSGSQLQFPYKSMVVRAQIAATSTVPQCFSRFAPFAPLRQSSSSCSSQYGSQAQGCP